MLADCSEGKMTVYNEDIMKFNVPAAFPNVEGVDQICNTFATRCENADAVKATTLL